MHSERQLFLTTDDTDGTDKNIREIRGGVFFAQRRGSDKARQERPTLRSNVIAPLPEAARLGGTESSHLLLAQQGALLIVIADTCAIDLHLSYLVGAQIQYKII